MNYCWITMKVSNIDSSLRFYHELLELPVGTRYESGGRSIAMLGDELKPTIELVCEKNNAKIRPNINISVSILVESLEQTLKLLINNNVKLLQGPNSINPQVKEAYVLDPDGYQVLLIESI